jgi:hypothetical protein
VTHYDSAGTPVGWEELSVGAVRERVEKLDIALRAADAYYAQRKVTNKTGD